MVGVVPLPPAGSLHVLLDAPLESGPGRLVQALVPVPEASAPSRHVFRYTCTCVCSASARLVMNVLLMSTCCRQAQSELAPS